MSQFRSWILLLLLITGSQFLLSNILYAQTKHDANWVFGKNCGIDFNDPQNPQLFEPLCDNIEIAASISDSLGNLLFYVSESTPISFPVGDILLRNEQNTTIFRILKLNPIIL